MKQPNISGVPEEITENIIKDISQESSREVDKFRVGISISENEDLGILGYSTIHLRDITIEIARHLLINNATIVYGGDLRRDGFTDIFSDLSYQYRSIAEIQTSTFINYFSYPIYLQLTRQNELEFKKNKTEIIKVQPPQGCQILDRFFPADTFENKSCWALSLSRMRDEMVENSDARILIGGKLSNYSGIAPGILEEASITIAKKKPLYLIGAFGGASKEVINGLEGRRFAFLDNAFHKSDSFTEFVAEYNRVQLNKIDFDSMCTSLINFGVSGLSAVNGLSVDDNRALFYTPHLSEILYYIFKGLKNLRNR